MDAFCRCGNSRYAFVTSAALVHVSAVDWPGDRAAGRYAEPGDDRRVGRARLVGRHLGGAAAGVCAAAGADRVSLGYAPLGAGIAPPALFMDRHVVAVRWSGDHAFWPAGAGPASAGHAVGQPDWRCTGVSAGGCRDAGHPDCGSGTGDGPGNARNAATGGGADVHDAVAGSGRQRRHLWMAAGGFQSAAPDSGGAGLGGCRDLAEPECAVEAGSDEPGSRAAGN